MDKVGQPLLGKLLSFIDDLAKVDPAKSQQGKEPGYVVTA